MISVSSWTVLGEHTTEKSVLANAAATSKQLVPDPTPATNSSSKDTCPRCRQGVFCSDHGSQARQLNPKASNVAVGEHGEVIQICKIPNYLKQRR